MFLSPMSYLKFPWKCRLWFKNKTDTGKRIWQWWQETLSRGHSESDKCISALVQGVESRNKGREGRHKGEDTVTTPR